MSTIDFACVFIRADGDRLLAAERLLCGFQHLFGSALRQTDLAFRVSSRYLVAVLRFDAEAFDERLRARLNFWTARAGGRASPLEGMSASERLSFDGQLEQCELRLAGLETPELFDRSARLFTEVGSPANRRRNPTDRPMMALDVGGAGWEGVTYQPEGRQLFVAAPLAPPTGDEVLLAFRIPGSEKPVGVRSRVASVRTPAEAAPGRPAGFSLAIPPQAEALHQALARLAPATSSEVRTAPRYHIKAPVEVLVPPAPAPAPASEPDAHAVIEYASDQELQADFVENLSHGGAFIRSAKPRPVGSEVALRFCLPNGAELEARAVVAFANATGMGVRFTLDPEADEVLQAAIAHISARPRRVLVVDDDALVRRMLGDALAERGFEVITAGDGQDGLRVLSEELLALDLLVTDVFMPGMDGEAFVKMIRRAGGESDLAIVVVTGQMQQGLERRLEAVGADAVLDKVLGPELVAQAADAVLERKRLSRVT
jgi:CheY-like chemotaxis protein